MAGKISEMVDAGALTGSELVMVSDPSGSPTTYSTKSTTTQAIADLASGSNLSEVIHAASGKTTPVDADEIPLSDSASSPLWGLKKLTWANLKATLKTYFDTLYSTTVGKHTIPVMAVSITPRQTGGCAALAYLSGASDQPDVPYLAFDGTSAEYAEFAIAMGSSWNESTVTFKPIWAHPTPTSSPLTYGVTWKLRAVAFSNDDARAANFGTAQSSSDTGGTVGDFYEGPESSAITIAGTPASGDTVCFQIYRDPTDGSDNMAADAYLIGVKLNITTDASVDA